MEESISGDKKAAGALPSGRLFDEEGRDGMPEVGSGDGGPDVEGLRRLKLTGFLRELVRAEGRMEAADLLGVNYRTLVRAEETSEMTGRMSDALERLLWKAGGAESVRMRDRVGALEERVETLAKGMEANPDDVGRGEAGDEGAPVPDEHRARAKDGMHQVEGVRPQPVPAPPVPGLRPRKPFRVRRPDPGVVTEEPVLGDDEVYGPAWPLVEEWRRLRDGHPHQGRSLSWLVTEERLLILELAMLEEHLLTLPPETEPLRGFGRRGQTGWRWKALDDTRRALHKRRMLRWLRRAFTCGLWWK